MSASDLDVAFNVRGRVSDHTCELVFYCADCHRCFTVSADTTIRAFHAMDDLLANHLDVYHRGGK